MKPCPIILRLQNVSYKLWLKLSTFQCSLQSLTVNNMYVGSGSDFTGVITKMLNLNGSLRISVYNPATFYGIHVSATPVNLIYSDVVVATGEVGLYELG